MEKPKDQDPGDSGRVFAAYNTHHERCGTPPRRRNTDNPGLFEIDLTHELEVCVGVLGFSDDDVRRVTANALDASFVDDAAKDDVRRRHFGWVGA